MPSPEFVDRWPLADEQTELIKQLRTEVFQIKDCIARYTLQCLAFGAVLLGGIFGAQMTFERAVRLGWLTVPVLLLLRAVCRTAVHKLGTINRNLGYELHLQRTRRLPQTVDGWRHSYREIGWEEAMRAWRVVQASLFARICVEAGEWIGRGHYEREFDPARKENRDKYLWYHVPTLVEQANRRDGTGESLKKRSASKRPSATYHAGNFVHKMLKIVHLMMVLCLAPQVWGLWVLTTTGKGQRWEVAVAAAVIVLSIVYVRNATDRDRVRLDQLESGILSIHSCAVVWQAVVVAHYRALSLWRERRYPEVSASQVAAETGYTWNLAVRAVELARDPLRIQNWIDGTLRAPRSKFTGAVEIHTATGSISARGNDVTRGSEDRIMGMSVSVEQGAWTSSKVCRVKVHDEDPVGARVVYSRTDPDDQKRVRIGLDLTAAL